MSIYTAPWIVIPFSRPAFIQNIVNNYNRQIIKPKLIVIENGDAIGCCSNYGFKPYAVLSCDSRVIGTIRNIGIDFAKHEDPNSPLGFWDDDDIYGSRYIEEAVTTLIDYNLGFTMKLCHLIKLKSGRIFLFDPDSANGTDTPNGILGATSMIRRADMSPKMKDVSREEDTDWGKEVLDTGVKFLTTSFKNFVHIRHSNNITNSLMSDESKIIENFSTKERWQLKHTDAVAVAEMQSLQELVVGAAVENLVDNTTGSKPLSTCERLNYIESHNRDSRRQSRVRR